uniref:CSON015485 protein n=1 Tax=Culicoides sonorensis TaxID=179676 RepID=A0A336MDE7_CULSO
MKSTTYSIKRVYLQLILTDHDADLDVWTSNNGGEPIYRDGKISGYTTTSSYGYSFKTQVCLGFVENRKDGFRSLPVTTDFILGGDYEVEVAGIRYSAKVNLHSPNLPTKADLPIDKDREEYKATRDKMDDSYFL